MRKEVNQKIKVQMRFFTESFEAGMVPFDGAICTDCFHENGPISWWPNRALQPNLFKILKKPASKSSFHRCFKRNKNLSNESVGKKVQGHKVSANATNTLIFPIQSPKA